MYTMIRPAHIGIHCDIVDIQYGAIIQYTSYSPSDNSKDVSKAPEAWLPADSSRRTVRVMPSN